MCNCINVKIGSYQNQVGLDCPKHMKAHINNSSIYVDTCLVDEIKYLWELGIKTTGSCCGHNKVDGFIGVFNEDILKMKALGYKVKYNACRPNDEDSFVPKSLNKKRIWYQY